MGLPGGYFTPVSGVIYPSEFFLPQISAPGREGKSWRPQGEYSHLAYQDMALDVYWNFFFSDTCRPVFFVCNPDPGQGIIVLCI